MTLSITPLTDTIGAELSGVDLAGDLNPDTRQSIYQAWVDNIVLVIRDQDLTPAQFVASAAIFGPIKQQNLDSFAVPEFPEINVVSSEDRNTDGTPPAPPAAGNIRWHGTTTAMGLLATARPTARAAPGRPIAVASSP